MDSSRHRAIDILLVEDSPSDAFLLKEVFKEGHLQNQVHHVTDGETAMAFLRREGEYCHAPRPDLILLDLHLPKKDGHEVLSEIRSDPDLTNLVVVVLTSSADEYHVSKAYGCRCNGYITKPVQMQDFVDVVTHVAKFFVSVVTLPPKPE